MNVTAGWRIRGLAWWWTGRGAFALAAVLSAQVLAAEQAGFEALTGAWVRPDGGYVILIKGVQSGGRIEATYFNPNPLPFARAQASRDGARVRAIFELQAGGYSGSTYDLVYDPASDQLKGVYYQAVAKQKFDIHFVRSRGGTIRQP